MSCDIRVERVEDGLSASLQGLEYFVRLGQWSGFCCSHFELLLFEIQGI